MAESLGTGNQTSHRTGRRSAFGARTSQRRRPKNPGSGAARIETPVLWRPTRVAGHRVRAGAIFHVV